MPTDFQRASYAIGVIKGTEYKILPADVPEEEFWERSAERWALDDLVGYLRDHWFDDNPIELISDYIEDCIFRSGKYWDHPNGKLYVIAKRVASEVMLHFV